MKRIFPVIILLALLAGCKGRKNERSTATGWNFNDKEWGGFIKSVNESQTIGPNLVPIEGGTFTQGIVNEDVMFDHNNLPKRVTVNSFFMDETEVTNIQYREYTYWVDRIIGRDYPHIAAAVRPDSLVWRNELSYNEPWVEYYFSFPAFDEYPVVGVTWEQANDYAVWRSDRVNEMLLRRRGIIEPDHSQTAGNNFNTDAYLIGKYEATDGPNALENLDPEQEGTRQVRRNDGILLPDYRLPTEAEWEYAALALQGNLIEGTEISRERRLYTWDGTSMRAQKGRDRGKFLVNMKRGRGDQMGVGGRLNDNGSYTVSVYANLPNDFGLFNMAGNVSEWVADVYRPLSPIDVEDFSPYRGNVFTRKTRNEAGEYEVDSLGRVKTRVETRADNENRRNYRDGDVRDHRDGDPLSGADYGYGVTTLISDEARVYKGGSWNDRAYFMSPGSRRYLQQTQASSEIGFRCAMDMLGGPHGNVIRGKASRKQMRRVKKNRKNREKDLYGKKKGFKTKKKKKSKGGGSNNSNGSGGTDDDSSIF